MKTEVIKKIILCLLMTLNIYLDNSECQITIHVSSISTLNMFLMGFRLSRWLEASCLKLSVQSADTISRHGKERGFS